MLQKTKNIAIFMIISIYCIGMIGSFFGDFLQHYQSVRYENQIQKLENATSLSFTEKEWNAFEDKNEIYHKSEFYDVISNQKINEKIIVKVVKDSTENNFRVVVNQSLKKHKIPVSDSKNSFKFSKHLTSKDDFNIGVKPIFIANIQVNFDSNFNQKTKNFIFIIENPPC
jgi:hypothetical protein